MTYHIFVHWILLAVFALGGIFLILYDYLKEEIYMTLFITFFTCGICSIVASLLHLNGLI